MEDVRQVKEFWSCLIHQLTRIADSLEQMPIMMGVEVEDKAAKTPDSSGTNLKEALEKYRHTFIQKDEK